MFKTVSFLATVALADPTLYETSNDQLVFTQVDD